MNKVYVWGARGGMGQECGRVGIPLVDLGAGGEMDEAEVRSSVCVGSHGVREEQDPCRDHMDLSMTGSSKAREEGHSVGREDKRIKYLEL